MIRKLLTLFSFFVFGVLTLAQTPAPVPVAIQATTFSVTTSAISLPGNRQSTSGALVGVNIAVTPNLSFEQTDFTDADGMTSGFYGGVRYIVPKFSTWLDNASPNLSGYDFQLSLSAHFGIDHVVPVGESGGQLAAQQHFSAMAGPRLSYAPKGSSTWSLAVDVRWLNLPRPGQRPNTWLVAAGPIIHF